jgi:hypothetical protein
VPELACNSVSCLAWNDRHASLCSDTGWNQVLLTFCPGWL